MTLTLIGIGHTFNFQSGQIDFLVIENKTIYFKLLKSIYLLDKEKINIYEEKELELKSYLLFIYNFLEFDPNSKKVLTKTYDEIKKEIDKDKINEKLSRINSLILELLEDIKLEVDFTSNYEDEINLTDILSLYKFKYDLDDLSFLAQLVQYIKAVSKYEKYRYIVTNNLCDFVDESALKLLKRELEICNLHLIDISNHKTIQNIENVDEYIYIDSDLCML